MYRLPLKWKRMYSQLEVCSQGKSVLFVRCSCVDSGILASPVLDVRRHHLLYRPLCPEEAIACAV